MNLGSKPYHKWQAQFLLWTDPRGDASLALAKQLIAAKLNVATGAKSRLLEAAIVYGDALLAERSDRLPHGMSSSTAERMRMLLLGAALQYLNRQQGQ